MYLKAAEPLSPLPMSPELPVIGSELIERADAARNRRRILAAADRLVAQRGVNCVTMDAIADAADVGKGTLFRRFGDRASLMHALLDDREREFQEAFIRGPAPLGPGAPARERLIAFGHALLDICESQGELLAAIEAADPVMRLRHPVYLTYRAHIAALMREGAPELDAEYAADVLLGPLTANVVLYQRRVREMPLERLKAGWSALVEMILRCRELD